MKRRVWPHMATVSVRCWARTFSPSASTSHRGFPPACAARFQAGDGLAGVHLRGVQRITASTSLIARLSARFCGDVLDSVFIGHFLGFCQVGVLMRETTARPNILMPSRCLMPKAPAPARATFDGHMSLRRAASGEGPLGAVNTRSDEPGHHPFSKKSGPRTAVLLAGTWKKRCATVGGLPPATSPGYAPWR